MWDLRSHSCWKLYSQKCFLLSGGDRFFPFLPGLYASLDQRFFDPRWCRPYCYTRVSCDESLEYSDNPDGRRYLFSFRGNVSTHPVRTVVMQLSQPDSVLTDTGAQSYVAANRILYRDEIRNSQFVLCPRGAGVSSFRVFECLAMGRAPVIIADDWTAPLGPDWSQFSIRVPENQVEQIPQILAARSEQAVLMGRLARQAWDQFFCANAAFDYIVSQCQQMAENRRSRPRLALYRHLLRPFFFKKCVLQRAFRLATGRAAVPLSDSESTSVR
ncbi:MAG: exostosin family protein [Planctomycetaceae bacterium]